MHTETITWRPIADGLPDAELTVLIACDTKFHSEPVWIGFHDGEAWREANGEPAFVTHWAPMLPGPDDARMHEQNGGSVQPYVQAGAPGATDAERAAWLADKIGALGDYAKEAAAMLRRWPAAPSGDEIRKAWNRTQDPVATVRAFLPADVMCADTRTCTCHHDDNPPKPCPRKFALSECRAAAGVRVPAASLLVTVCEMRDGDGLTHCAMLHHQDQRPLDGMCVERRADRSEVEAEAAEWREFLTPGVMASDGSQG